MAGNAPLHTSGDDCTALAISLVRPAGVGVSQPLGTGSHAAAQSAKRRGPSPDISSADSGEMLPHRTPILYRRASGSPRPSADEAHYLLSTSRPALLKAGRQGAIAGPSALVPPSWARSPGEASSSPVSALPRASVQRAG